MALETVSQESGLPTHITVCVFKFTLYCTLLMLFQSQQRQNRGFLVLPRSRQPFLQLIALDEIGDPARDIPKHASLLSAGAATDALLDSQCLLVGRFQERADHVDSVLLELVPATN